MIDMLAAFQLAEAAFDLGLEWGDLMLVYQLYQSGKVDFAAVAKSESALNSIARLTGVVNHLLTDETQRPKAVALLQQIATMFPAK